MTSISFDGLEGRTNHIEDLWTFIDNLLSEKWQRGIKM